VCLYFLPALKDGSASPEMSTRWGRSRAIGDEYPGMHFKLKESSWAVHVKESGELDILMKVCRMAILQVKSVTQSQDLLQQSLLRKMIECVTCAKQWYCTNNFFIHKLNAPIEVVCC
jgi:hypothetical protein